MWVGVKPFTFHGTGGKLAESELEAIVSVALSARLWLRCLSDSVRLLVGELRRLKVRAL